MKIVLQGKILNYLNLTIPRLLTFRWGWFYLLTVSVINILMVYHLHPFGEPDPLLPHQPTLLTGFAWICIGMYIILYQLLPVAMKRLYKKEHWTLAYEFITLGIYFLLMLILNWVYASLIIPVHEPGWHFFCKILCFSLLYQILPVVLATAIYLIGHLLNTLLEPNVPEIIVEDIAAEPLPNLVKPNVPEILVEDIAPDTLLDLTLFNAGKYPMCEIWFFNVIENYCYMHYNSAGKRMEINLKISLIKMEELLKPYPRFVRCHNQHIVNTDKIEKRFGSKKKMKVQLIGCKTILSVSYRHAEEIIQLIKKRSKKD